MDSCELIYGCKLDRKKYKTLRGLEKHYKSTHQSTISSFEEYRKSHVLEKRAALQTPSNTTIKTKKMKPNPTRSPLTSRDVDTLNDTNISRILDRLASLEREVETLKIKLKDQSHMLERNDDSKLCSVCWEHDSEYALLPCGHKVLCGTCVVNILSTSRRCPICQQNVYDMLRIYEDGI